MPLELKRSLLVAAAMEWNGKIWVWTLVLQLIVDDLGQVNLTIKPPILPPSLEMWGLEEMESIEGHWPRLSPGLILSCSPAGASLICCECTGGGGRGGLLTLSQVEGFFHLDWVMTDPSCYSLKYSLGQGRARGHNWWRDTALGRRQKWLAARNQGWRGTHHNSVPDS